MRKFDWRGLCIFLSVLLALVITLWIRDVQYRNSRAEGRSMIAELWFSSTSAMRLGCFIYEQEDAIQMDLSALKSKLDIDFAMFVGTAWGYEDLIESFEFDPDVCNTVREVAAKFGCNSKEDVLDKMKKTYENESEESKKTGTPWLFDATSFQYVEFREFLSRVFEDAN